MNNKKLKKRPLTQQKLKSYWLSSSIALITIFSWLAGSVFAHAENDGTRGGGWVEEMREAELKSHQSLTESEIIKATEANGKEIKLQLLIPFYEDFLTLTSLNDKTLEEIQAVMKKNEAILHDDIMFSKILIGTCPNRENLCTTQNKIYSDIVVDLKSLLATHNGVTFSEFVGLLAHEYTHHFAGDIDHPYYKFARFVTELVRENKIGKKTFLFEDLIVMLPEIYLNYGDIYAPHTEIIKRHAALAEHDSEKDKITATNICLFHNYSKMIDFETHLFNKFDIEDVDLREISQVKSLYSARAYECILTPTGKIAVKVRNHLFIYPEQHIAEVALFTKIVCQK
jgi:hypothetical protein